MLCTIYIETYIVEGVGIASFVLGAAKLCEFCFIYINVYNRRVYRQVATLIGRRARARPSSHQQNLNIINTRIYRDEYLLVYHVLPIQCNAVVIVVNIAVCTQRLRCLAKLLLKIYLCKLMSQSFSRDWKKNQNWIPFLF